MLVHILLNYCRVLLPESKFRTWLWKCRVLLIRPVFIILNTPEAILRILCVYCNSRILFSFIVSFVSLGKLEICLLYWCKNNFCCNRLQVVAPKTKRARRLESFNLLSCAKFWSAYFTWNPGVCYFRVIFSLTFRYICITQFRFHLYTILSNVLL
jgi:hypothetical protein